MKKSVLKLIIKEEISKIIAEQNAQPAALMKELDTIAYEVAQLKVRLEKVMKAAERTGAVPDPTQRPADARYGDDIFD